jgi:hypothetical protein
MSEKPHEHPYESLWAELMRSNTRFQVWGLLSIYQEMTLSQISKALHKSRSTIHDQLQIMIDSKIVVVSREAPSKSNLNTKYYSLVPEMQEDVKSCQEDHDKCEKNHKISSRIRGLKAFAQYNSRLLQGWIEYLTTLEKLAENGKENEVEEEFHKMEKEYINPLHAISFYSLDQARKNRENTMKEYMQYEQSERQVQEKKRTEKPILMTTSVIPIKHVLEFLNKKRIKQLKGNPPETEEEIRKDSEEDETE